MIIYLNGASSSGKSSIARELQKLTHQPLFYFSIDTLLYSLAPDILEGIQGNKPLKSEINWGDVFEGYFECVAVLQQSGNSVIADCPVYSEALQELFNRSLAGESEKLVVGLDCPLPVLEAREKQRKDRKVGLAKRHHSAIHDYMEYDLKVDSANQTPVQIAKALAQKLGF